MHHSFLCYHSQRDFDNYFQFFEHILSKLRGICNSSIVGYRFDMVNFTDHISSSTVIESILQIKQVKWCQNVRIELRWMQKIELPIEAIKNWLIRTSGQQIAEKKTQKIEFFKGGKEIRNVHELGTRLKKVLIVLF